MSKTGGAITKLAEKSKRNAMAQRMGTHKPMISRVSTSHHEKAVAFLAHKRAIHGFMRDGVEIQAGGFNPGPAECFHGDGLPDEVIPGSKNWEGVKPAKTNAQRAEEDKRKPLKDEMVDGWKPQPFVRGLNRSARRALERAKA